MSKSKVNHPRHYLSVTKERNNIAAYVDLAKEQVASGNITQAYITASELTRLDSNNGFLNEKITELELEIDLDLNQLTIYKNRAGLVLAKKSISPRSILIITNIFPPQKLGGFGRTMFEFSEELLTRGHRVRVITSDTPKLKRKHQEFHKKFEINVNRSLKLFGDWIDGAAVAEPSIEKRHQIATYNEQTVLDEVKEFCPDIVIVGNLDFLGNLFIKKLTDLNIPVLHRLGNSFTGSEPNETPTSAIYWMAACSKWVNDVLRNNGYKFKKYLVIPPGSPLHYYYRYYPPNRETLKILYSGLILPFKGAHILLQALVYLKHMNIPFECNFAGDTLSDSYLENLKLIAHVNKISDYVNFIGFLSIDELSKLYASSNTLVFPSVFEEPFGKSQVEAMAAGLLVISSDTKGSIELLSDKNNALIFKKNDAYDLSQKLIWAHNHQLKAAEIAKIGQNYSFKYTTSNCVDLLETALDQMITYANSRK